MLHTKHDSELIIRHTLDRAGNMFVTDLIRDTLTSLTPCRNCVFDLCLYMMSEFPFCVDYHFKKGMDF